MTLSGSFPLDKNSSNSEPDTKKNLNMMSRLSNFEKFSIFQTVEMPIV